MKEKARVEEHTSLFNEQALSLERLLNELQYPDHIEKAVKEKLEKPDIAEIASIAYSGEGFDYPLCKRMPLTRLAVVTWLLQKTYGEYKAIGVADDIIFETFRDVTLRATLYYQKTEKVGISKEDVIWFRHLMNVNMFKVGALQFQPFEMIYLDEETIIPRLLFLKTVKIWTLRHQSCLLPQRSICIRAMFAALRAVKTWKKRCGISRAEASTLPQSRNSVKRQGFSLTAATLYVFPTRPTERRPVSGLN